MIVVRHKSSINLKRSYGCVNKKKWFFLNITSNFVTHTSCIPNINANNMNDVIIQSKFE